MAARVAALPQVRIVHRQADALVFGPPGRPDVVLAGHSDTVPEQGNLPGRLEGGWVHGLGAADMKGSLAVMLALAAELDALAPPQLTPLFVGFGREEVALEESVLAGPFAAGPGRGPAARALGRERRAPGAQQRAGGARGRLQRAAPPAARCRRAGGRAQAGMDAGRRAGREGPGRGQLRARGSGVRAPARRA